MCNDFKTPEVFASLFQLIREFNRVSAEPLASATPAASLGAQAFIDLLEKDLGEIVGMGRLEASKALADLSGIRAARAGSKITPEQVEKLLSERIEARKARNFARADEIRKELDSQGVAIKDGPQGTTCERSFVSGNRSWSCRSTAREGVVIQSARRMACSRSGACRF
jgi:cysteinyl-tRNA synthetase